jgi:hypothetical protein
MGNLQSKEKYSTFVTFIQLICWVERASTDLGAAFLGVELFRAEGMLSRHPDGFISTRQRQHRPASQEELQPQPLLERENGQLSTTAPTEYRYLIIHYHKTGNHLSR